MGLTIAISTHYHHIHGRCSRQNVSSIPHTVCSNEASQKNSNLASRYRAMVPAIILSSASLHRSNCKPFEWGASRGHKSNRNQSEWGGASRSLHLLHKVPVRLRRFSPLVTLSAKEMPLQGVKRPQYKHGWLIKARCWGIHSAFGDAFHNDDSWSKCFIWHSLGTCTYREFFIG